MPPHYSHLLQPLDVGVFAAFKRAHNGETDVVSKLNTQRILRFKWLQIFQRAKSKAVTPTNIRAEWKRAGLISSTSTEVFERISINISFSSQSTRTPPD